MRFNCSRCEKEIRIFVDPYYDIDIINNDTISGDRHKRMMFCRDCYMKVHEMTGGII